MILSINNLKNINVPGLQKPNTEIFNLPDKVLQFGTGVLLRGLPDYFIDRANRQGIFNGRVVLVKSTGTGSADDFAKQDGLYTIYSKGIENGKEASEEVICSSISKVLSASSDWGAVLAIAGSRDLQIVISNTTEIGIQLVEEDINQQPPQSFPGKLLAVLYERYNVFSGSAASGLIIIPTELITDNGQKLKSIILDLARFNKLENDFIIWIEHHNTFCNSLVDRIVPGKPVKELAAQLENERGYTDNLHIMSEIYCLWAIEGDDKVASALSFAKADDRVIIAPDIEIYRELKLRLLNGSHTLSCAVAIISGLLTVKEAMDNSSLVKFISELAYKEIIPSIPYKIDPDAASDFAAKVLDRFRNPHIRHEWLSISLQYSTKIKMRVIPLLLNYYRTNNAVPANMALGFAAFIRFMKTEQATDGTYKGSVNQLNYAVTDSQAAYFSKVWENANADQVVKTVLSNNDLWGADLTELPGFEKTVVRELNKIMAGEKESALHE
ncbi:MAG: tagaturonate reductase [Bacteroidetes bacterium]|nr:tagaturonate reductase [Bacteroidota bacterium]